MNKSAVKKTNKRGRKPIRISKKKVEEYLRIGLYVREIAKLLGVDEKTIRNKFSAEIKKRDHEKILEHNDKIQRLIEKQFEVAMEGNPILLIWLGKNWLNQTDKVKSDEKRIIRIIKEEIK